MILFLSFVVYISNNRSRLAPTFFFRLFFFTLASGRPRVYFSLQVTSNLLMQPTTFNQFSSQRSPCETLLTVSGTFFPPYSTFLLPFRLLRNTKFFVVPNTKKRRFPHTPQPAWVSLFPPEWHFFSRSLSVPSGHYLLTANEGFLTSRIFFENRYHLVSQF